MKNYAKIVIIFLTLYHLWVINFSFSTFFYTLYPTSIVLRSSLIAEKKILCHPISPIHLLSQRPTRVVPVLGV